MPKTSLAQNGVKHMSESLIFDGASHTTQIYSENKMSLDRMLLSIRDFVMFHFYLTDSMNYLK